MADVLSTGLSSLRALQRALDTTSHNIANVSTEGYTRQRVEFQTRRPESSGSGWIGTGVQTSTVRRVYDQFLAQQTRSSGTNLARLDAFASQAERIDNLLGDSANGLSSSLQSFTDAINEVSTTPASIPARQVLIAEGRALAERLKSYDARLRDMSAEVNGRLSVEAQDITHARAGHRQAQRQHLGRRPADRPAAERPARPARCAHQRAVGQGRRLRRRRRRLDAQRIHRQWPAAGARQPGVAGHDHGGSARSGTHAAVAAARARAPSTCRA